MSYHKEKFSPETKFVFAWKDRCCSGEVKVIFNLTPAEMRQDCVLFEVARPEQEIAIHKAGFCRRHAYPARARLRVSPAHPRPLVPHCGRWPLKDTRNGLFRAASPSLALR